MMDLIILGRYYPVEISAADWKDIAHTSTRIVVVDQSSKLLEVQNVDYLNLKGTVFCVSFLTI